MGEAQPKADAIRFKRGWRPPGSQGKEPVDAVLDFAEALVGRKCWVRDCSGEYDVFVAPFRGDRPAPDEPHPTLYFPTGHELAGQARYDWRDDPSGCLVGTLVEAARG